MENKLETITKLFEGSEIRSIWDSQKQEYYFSVVDVIKALTDSDNPRNYWNMLKKRMTEDEKSELYTKCVQLKMKSKKDGKNYLTDTLDTKGILRLIESVPSPKAEPFKLWLANLGSERVDEVFDPSIGIDKMIDFYLNKGYTLEWIELRIKAIINRKKLTNTWKEGGIKENKEYAILTNDIYKEWSGMTASEYKKFKNIRKENLRDNMTDIEVALADLGEIATRELAKEHKPYGLAQNRKIAQMGGSASKAAKDNIEQNLGHSIITNKNKLSYKYKE